MMELTHCQTVIKYYVMQKNVLCNLNRIQCASPLHSLLPFEKRRTSGEAISVTDVVHFYFR